MPIKRWTSTEGRWLKMFLRTGLHPAPEKFFCLTFLKPITRRRKSMDIDLGISVLALRCAYRGPQIFLFPIGQFCTSPEMQYPLMQLVQYISYFLVSIFFAIENTYRYDVELDGRGIIGTVLFWDIPFFPLSNGIFSEYQNSRYNDRM